MSLPRIICPERLSFYHVYSRIVDRQFVMGDQEKRFFFAWMRRLERFCGVQVVTYCLMSNHFHLLVRVPEKRRLATLEEATLRELLPVIYSGRQLLDAVQELDRASAAAVGGSRAWLDEILERYHARRYDLSAFVKELKQRFTQWFNGRTERVGTLWEDKFHSVLVEGDEQALLTMAAYIDLNPVRAGLVDDPKDYRWSGYGEAVAGKSPARKGLAAILVHSRFGINRTVSWRNTGPRYRILLYGQGEARDADGRTGSPGRAGLSQAEVERQLARGGVLSLAQVLRCKVRYFCDGAVFGSAGFVDGVFRELTDATGSAERSRKTGSRVMKGAGWGMLRTLRDLQKSVISMPGAAGNVDRDCA